MARKKAASANNDLFVGREAELAKFREMLDTSEGPWLLWIVGPGGQGKTALLSQFLELCRERRLRNSGVVDFFDRKLHTKLGTLSALAGRFGVSDDPAFREARKQYEDEHSYGENADRDVIEYARIHMEDALITAIRPRRRGVKPRVILVDTIELIARADLARWLFCELLPRLRPFFWIVAAGRELPERCMQELGDQADLTDLEQAQLTETDVRDYFERVGLPPQEPVARRVYELSQGKGQPLLVALACDAILDGHLDLVELESVTPRDFEYHLVVEPFELADPEHMVMLAMAHALHRFDPGILLTLYPHLEELDAQSYEDFVEQLSRFKFVKYRPEVKTATLHDYFRDRLYEWYWRAEDPDMSVRSAMSASLVAHYEQRLQAIGANGRFDIPEADALRYERLYHLLYSDRERAYGELWHLLDRSWHLFKYDYMDLILNMMWDFNVVDLNPQGKFDVVLNRLEQAARAWMYLETWRLEEARDLAEELIKDPAGMRRIHTTAVVAKATVLGWLGQTDEAIRLLQEAYEEYTDLLPLAEAAERADLKAQEDLEGEHGVATVHGIRPERYLILNTIGVFERRRGRFDEAERAFRESFELSQAEGDRAWIASAATQIGTILRYRGDMQGAYDYIELGLDLRKRLEQRGREAFSLQALGMLQRDDGRLREARQSIQRALDIWSELRTEAYMAIARRNLGWVDYLEEKYDDADQHYREAEDIHQRLPGTIREIPSLRHKQGLLWIAKARHATDQASRSESLDKAEEYLKEGLELAKQYEDALFAVLCLADLCRIAEMRGEYQRISEWSEEVQTYKDQGYLFGPAYADLEFVLGDVAYHNARVDEPDFNKAHLNEAIDRYGQAYLDLVSHDPRRYQQRLESLRKLLSKLPDELRRQAAQRLITFWNEHPDITSPHQDFIRTCRVLGRL